MTPSDDLSLPRRPIFFPVVIATVFLTIIGMTVGFVLGERHRARMRAVGPGQIVTQPTDAGETAPPARPEPSGPFCPDETRKTSASLGFPADLRQVMKIVTDKGTVAWICQDATGSLYYQGKTGGVDAPLVEKKNALFLSQVSRLGEDDYEATAVNGTRYVVTRDLLEVHFPDGRPTRIDQVVKVE